MITKLVWENIRFRPVRTLLSVLLIAVPVTLILTLVGLSEGFLSDSARRARGVGADIVFRAKGSSLLSFSGASLQSEFVDLLAKQPHIKQATGVVIYPIGGFDSVSGIDVPAFEKMSGGFVYLQGHGFQKPDDIVIDEYYAEQRKVRAGEKLKVMNIDWTVAGVVEPGKLSHVFLPIQILAEKTASEGMVSQIYLKADSEENVDTAVAALKKKFEEYPIYTMREAISLTSVSNIPLLKNFINVVLGIGVVIGFSVVSLSMYMAVLQRTREIGILKSLGATKAFIMNMILTEALIMGLGGTVFGIILSYITKFTLQKLVPASLPPAIVMSWWPIAGGIAVGAALLGALYPGMLAVRQDPIEALAYE